MPIRDRRLRLLGILAAGLFAATCSAQEPTYFPGPQGEWESRLPEQLGMDSDRLREAVGFAKANETGWSRDLEANHHISLGREPFGEAIGPFKSRGEMTGVIVRRGYIVAEWGEPHRVDMAYSVSKSFLSTTVGLAVDRGLIRDLNDRVGPYMPTDHFAGEHNSKITWNHLLRQTSNWEGSLWGKPDWADRAPREGGLGEWRDRERPEPGSAFVYNDVRVNLLALAALHVWRRPLPIVLKEHVMDPIGASSTWRWYGYDNSWVTIDGMRMQSVTGGGHWGGGMFLSARDMARFGYFVLRRGRWGEQQLLSDEWFTKAVSQTSASEHGYGFMNYFLNGDGQTLPSAPKSAHVHIGNGNNIIYIDPDNDLVVVARWIGPFDKFIGRVLEAIDG